jgi:hypothetical protein
MGLSTLTPARRDRTRADAVEVLAAREALQLLHDGAATPAGPCAPLHPGLLTVLLRLIFVVHAEDRGLLPVEHSSYYADYSVLGLRDRLHHDSVDPDAMARSFGAWTRLLAAWRALYHGVRDDLHMPARAGDLFDPAASPWLDHLRIDDLHIYRVLQRLLHHEGRRIDYRNIEVEQLGAVYEALMGDERGRTGAHYTPSSLTGPIVRETLEPLLAALGPTPTAQQILGLAICDPAMGSGAFLLAVVRMLGERLVAAWAREGAADIHPDPVMHARRLVACRCIHGVDKNPLAVHLTRLSLWLVAGARDLPFSFVDHALRHGDALVGLTLDQLRAFHWAPSPALAPIDVELQRALTDAALIRRPLRDPQTDGPTFHRLLRGSDLATARARLIADLVIGAFFAGDRAGEREQERKRRLDLVLAWLASDAPPPLELLQLQAALRERLPTFHWPLEFPEVFTTTAMSAVVGNPPFMGGSQLSGAFGPAYLAWVLALHPGAHGNADLSAHFLRRADTLLGSSGTIGLIATNTIGQGDTRATGLQHLVARRGYTIYAATRSMRWPETGAAVTIAVVHLARGLPLDHHDLSIDSRLRPARERPDPRPLRQNRELSFLGHKTYGQGFILDPAERDALIARDPRNAGRIFPYIGGDEINTSPDQRFARYVICFDLMELSEASGWPELLDIVRARVKPGREHNNRAAYRERWWLFAEYRRGLVDALRGLPECLAISRHSKHLVFVRQPTDRIFSEAINVFALPGHAAFATLQSRIHEPWARLLSSSLADRLRYSIADCFDPFPFPTTNPREELPALAAIGEHLHAARSAYMLTTRQGLTGTYNALKDPDRDDPQLLPLRALHLELDRAVLHAYGWHDLEVPAYTTPRSPAARAALEGFEDAVLARLFALNAARAADEQDRRIPPPRKRGRAGGAPRRAAQ